MLGGSIVALAAAAASVAGIAATVPAAPATPSGPTVADAVAAPAARRISALEHEVLGEVNALRRRHGLVPLRLSAGLSRAAASHSRQMGARGFFEHDSADGSAFWRRVERFYPSKRWDYWSVGENLLWASPDIDAPGAVKLWLESPEHRKNLLTARWREVGLAALAFHAAPGTFKGLDVTILTANFGVRR